MRSLALFCSRVGSISLSENFFTQSHSWAQSYHSEYVPPSSHFWPFLSISRLFKAIQGYFRQFQDSTSYFTLFQSISTYVSLFGPITFYLLLVVALRLWSFVFRRLLPLGAKGLLQNYSVIRKEISTPKMRGKWGFSPYSTGPVYWKLNFTPFGPLDDFQVLFESLHKKSLKGRQRISWPMPIVAPIQTKSC